MPPWGAPAAHENPDHGTGAACRAGVEVGCRMVPLSPRSIGTQALPGTPDCCVPTAGQHA